MSDERIVFPKHAREVYRAISTLDASIELDPVLRELVKLRASLLNGCAFCIDLHGTDALAAGEDQRRIWAVSAWQESPFFSERERAALALTDAMTLIAGTGVSDEVYAAAARHFAGDELGNLMGAIIAINAWNRVAITTEAQPPPLEPAPA